MMTAVEAETLAVMMVVAANRRGVREHFAACRIERIGELYLYSSLISDTVSITSAREQLTIAHVHNEA